VPSEPSPAHGRIRFGDFEVDLRSHELLRAGRRIRLQEKSFLVLQKLIAEAGRAVTREELAAALWPKEYFVDAEHGLNTAIRRLREALDDSADAPRWIETLPKVGYRFIGAVETGPDRDDLRVDPPSAGAQEQSSGPVIEMSPPALPDRSPEPKSSPLPKADPTPPSRAPARPPRARLRRAALPLAALLVAGAIALVAALATRSRPPAPEAGTATPRPTPETAEVVEELLARSRFLRNVKRNSEAKRFVEEALRIDPANADAVAGLALSLLGEGKDEQAREAARRALELDPETAEAHRALGTLARSAGDFAGAERHLRRALETAPAEYKSRNRLARHLLECGRFDEARVLILETKRLAPDDPDVQNIWLEYWFRTGDYEAAIRQGESWLLIWGQQIAGQPTPGVRDMLGLAYVGARRHEEALAQFRAIDADDELRVALALGYAGRSGEARAILDAQEGAAATARADPGHAGAMAMAYVALGDFDRAFAHLDRQLAGNWYPGWLNCALFRTIRRDPRWPAFAARLERDFFGGRERPATPVLLMIQQIWPRPTTAPALPNRS
jgi:DNA-binding winged helix-turn-helix (wHTH) protein/Tfp pilus assembly protein PilF